VFPQVDLSNLSELSIEDLDTLIAECRQTFDEAAESASTAEDVAALDEGANVIEALEAERASRRTPSEIAAAARQRVGASTQPRRTPAAPRRRDLRGMRSQVPADRTPRPAAGAGAVRITNAHGAVLADFRHLAEEAATAFDRVARNPGPDGLIPIATIRAEVPDERQLRSGAGAPDNTALVAAVLDAWNNLGDDGSLTAAGGLCAPVTPYYEQLVISDVSRPVRDFLPSFGADRGGITLIAPPTLANLAGAVTIVTAAQDAAGGAGSEKPCLHVPCGAARTYHVSAVSHCIEAGNFSARAFPEQVEAWLASALTYHARRAETALLDGIAANSVAITAPGGVGAAREIPARIIQAAAGYRSRHRMARGAVLDVLLPSWVPSAIRADMARGSQPISLPSDAEIEGWLNAENVRVGWYQDSKTGGAQVFGAQAAGAMLTFPDLVFYCYAPGTFLFLDGGELSFGVVRDSTLNARNDHRLMAETFEQLAYLGVESLEVTMPLCADGTTGAAITRTLACPA